MLKFHSTTSQATVFVRNPYLWLFLFCLLAPLSQAQSQSQTEPETTASEDNAEIKTLEQTIEVITLRRKALQDKRSEIAQRLAQASTAEAEILQQQLPLLDQTATVLTAQINEWNQSRELDAKKAVDLQEIARLQKNPEADKSFTPLDLDRAREQLTVESAQMKMVRTRVDLAEKALEQAKSTLKQKQEQLTQVQSSNGDAEPAKLKTATLQQDLAEQQQALHQLKLKNEKKSFSVYETHLHLLRQQVEFLQKYARFDGSVLKTQIESINKQEFELKRELAQIKDQSLKSQSLLDGIRQRLEATSFEDKQIVEEAEAQRLELEALKSKTDATQRELQLLAEQKALWQKRHDMFNHSVESKDLPKWRSQANADIAQLDQEQATIKLWLSDWQNRLNAVNRKVAYSTPDIAPWQTRQSEQIQSIIDILTDLNAAFDKNRRLQQHLINDINVRTSQYSLSDRLRSLAAFEINHNSLLDWVYAFAVASLSFMLLYILRWLLIRRLKKAAENNQFFQANEVLLTVNRANLIFFLVIAAFFASLLLTLDPTTDATIAKITKAIIALQVAIWLSGFLRAWIFHILSRKTKRDGASMGALAVLNFISQIVLWSVALLLVLQNIGIDITALVAGLGIGGIAVALSLQRILNDLFASLSIVLDRPFVIGDFVMFDDFLGTVEHIGIKTTRLRSLTGEQIICSNGELLNTRIRNFKRMQERRVVFKIGVIYATSYEKLQRIPAMLKAIVEALDNTRFDRAHFFQYGDFSLNFEIVYYVLSPDYNLYMDAQQAINLEIYQKFQQEGIEFAYPTQSLYVNNKTVSPHQLTEKESSS